MPIRNFHNMPAFLGIIIYRTIDFFFSFTLCRCLHIASSFFKYIVKLGKPLCKKLSEHMGRSLMNFVSYFYHATISRETLIFPRHRSVHQDYFFNKQITNALGTFCKHTVYIRNFHEECFRCFAETPIWFTRNYLVELLKVWEMKCGSTQRPATHIVMHNFFICRPPLESSER